MHQILYPMNTIGTRFCFTSFGESHGVAIGGIIDGCPAGLRIDFDAIRVQLARRAQGGSMRAALEADEIEWLSGIVEGVTLGTPIAFLIRNREAASEDYEALRDVFRPGHADYTYYAKYGIRDYRGGGRASARETAARVVAGTIARQLLEQRDIYIEATLTQVGKETDPTKMTDLIEKMRSEGDSIGGIVSCRVSGLPAGIGEPIFDKLQARLAAAIMSINACKGFDYGTGFEGVHKRGSEINAFTGGIAGGISDGTDIYFRCVFKPTPSIAIPQEMTTVQGDTLTMAIHGRHDVCLAVRAVPVVEAMTALTLVDLVL